MRGRDLLVKLKPRLGGNFSSPRAQLDLGAPGTAASAPFNFKKLGREWCDKCATCESNITLCHIQRRKSRILLKSEYLLFASMSACTDDADPPVSFGRTWTANVLIGTAFTLMILRMRQCGRMVDHDLKAENM
jgi:hypothetical protein